jgi:hypothetical protein
MSHARGGEKGGVFVSRYAATAENGTANHGDEAPVVAHDMALLGLGPGLVRRRRGLRVLAGVMHGKWSRFVTGGGGTGGGGDGDGGDDEGGDLQRRGGDLAGDLAWEELENAEEPDGDGGEDTGDDEEEGDDGKEVEWPAFVSPFAKDGRGPGEGTGKIMVFGEGNDEMGGGNRTGVPAKVVEMTELEKAACRFWWERVPLSEGLGRREGEGMTGARL